MSKCNLGEECGVPIEGDQCSYCTGTTHLHVPGCVNYPAPSVEPFGSAGTAPPVNPPRREASEHYNPPFTGEEYELEQEMKLARALAKKYIQQIRHKTPFPGESELAEIEAATRLGGIEGTGSGEPSQSVGTNPKPLPLFKITVEIDDEKFGYSTLGFNWEQLLQWLQALKDSHPRC